MHKFAFPILTLLATSFLLNSCGTFPDFDGTPYPNSDYSFRAPSISKTPPPFKVNDVLVWYAGNEKGTMKVVYLNKGTFTLEQRFDSNNKRNKDITLSGTLFDDGSCKIVNSFPHEEWLGNLYGASIVGKVNNVRDFKILWETPAYMSHTLPKTSKFPFSKGDTLKWESAARNGKFKVISINNDRFVLEKFDNFNKTATPVKMEGTIKKDGSIKLVNASSKKEVWTGKLVNNSISGKRNDGYNFKISRSNFTLDLPFKTGNILNYTKNYSKGTMKVVSVSSNGKFAVDIYVGKTKHLPYTRLNGEILADGTYKLVDSKSNEIWIGRRNGKEISGRVNNSLKFVISGLN